MSTVLHETCGQYIERRLSEGWGVAGRYKHLVFLSPPDGSFIRPVDLRNDIETLKPNATGDETSIPDENPPDYPHWQIVSGDVSGYVSSDYYGYLRDLYNLPAHSVGSGTINSITIYICISSTSSMEIYGVYARVSQKSGLTVTDGSQQYSWGIAWVWKSQTYTTNPATGNPYTWEEIDDLQIGLMILPASTLYAARCSQVYVEIDYTPPLQYRDIYTRFRLFVQGYRDTATRFLLTVLNYQDTATRFRLAVQAYKDTATRFSLVVAKDIATRFRLRVQAFKDIATRFKLMVLFKDVATRFKLWAEAYQDIATRFILYVLNYQDIVTRFRLIAPSYSDTGTRFRLLSPETHQDVSTRFLLYQPSWKALQILGDIETLKAKIAGLKRKPAAHFEI